MNLFKQYKSFNDILPLFLKAREITCKKATLKGSKTHMNIFKEWLDSQRLSDIPLRKITKYHIESFSGYLADKDNGRGLDMTTCEKYRLSLSSLFNFAIERGEVDVAPVYLFTLPPKGKDCSAELIPEDKISPLVMDIEENDYQLFVAIMSIWGCGLRPRKELRLRKVKDFNLNEGYVRVTSENAKIGKTGIVTIPEWLISIYKQYGLDGADGEMYVFGKNHHIDSRVVSENMLSYRFNQFRDSHGLSKGVSMYSFKHLGSRAYLKIPGNDIVGLMRLLRHSNLSSTQKYVQKTLGIVDMNYQKNSLDPRLIAV